jgi:hypothetical protein
VTIERLLKAFFQIYNSKPREPSTKAPPQLSFPRSKVSRRDVDCASVVVRRAWWLRITRLRLRGASRLNSGGFTLSVPLLRLVLGSGFYLVFGVGMAWRCFLLLRLWCWVWLGSSPELLLLRRWGSVCGCSGWLGCLGYGDGCCSQAVGRYSSPEFLPLR